MSSAIYGKTVLFWPYQIRSIHGSSTHPNIHNRSTSHIHLLGDVSTLLPVHFIHMQCHAHAHSVTLIHWLTVFASTITYVVDLLLHTQAPLHLYTHIIIKRLSLTVPPYLTISSLPFMWKMTSLICKCFGQMWGTWNVLLFSIPFLASDQSAFTYLCGLQSPKFWGEMN